MNDVELFFTFLFTFILLGLLWYGLNIATKQIIYLFFSKKQLKRIKEIIESDKDVLDTLIKEKLTNPELIKIAQQQILKEKGGKNVKIQSEDRRPAAASQSDSRPDTGANYVTERFRSG